MFVVLGTDSSLAYSASLMVTLLADPISLFHPCIPRSTSTTSFNYAFFLPMGKTAPSIDEKVAAVIVADSNTMPAAVVHSHAKPKLHLNRNDRKLFEDFMQEVENAICHGCRFPIIYALSHSDPQTHSD